MAVASMESNDSRREFWRGVHASVPVIVAVLPFGLLFGALAVGNGLSVFEATLMSGAVYGGASQMVGIELFGNHVAPWLVVASIFVVNFRHVLYSAAFGRRIAGWPLMEKAVAFFFLTDPQYAEAERKAEHGEMVGFAWYIGMALPIWLFWVVETAIGAYFGRLVANPQALGLDFLLPIYFLGLVMSFRKRPLWLPVVAVSAIASIAAYKLVGSPWHVTVGAIAGVAVAAVMPIKAVPAETEASDPGAEL